MALATKVYENVRKEKESNNNETTEDNSSDDNSSNSDVKDADYEEK